MTDAETAAGDSTAGDVRWLDESQQHRWRQLLTGTTYLLAALDHDLVAGVGLSLPEYEILVRLSEAPERTLRMSVLAGSLLHSRSRLTHTVSRMERAGLVERHRCEADRRGILATMTSLGWERLVSAAPVHVASVRERIVDVLAPDQFTALGEAMGVIVGGPGLRD